MPHFTHRKASRAKAAEERAASETGENPQQRHQGLQWLVEELGKLKGRLRAAYSPTVLEGGFMATKGIHKRFLGYRGLQSVWDTN
eukprot:5821214-Pleurochrysis_carterae.AAC.1